MNRVRVGFMMWVVAVLLGGCAPKDFTPQGGVWFFHDELIEADRAIDGAVARGKHTRCREAFQEVVRMRDRAYDLYLACRTAEGREQAEAARDKARALCPVRDSDHDFVEDDRDECPNTPDGVLVDDRGCPFDQDQDGVPDFQDACPRTPLGTVVDERGCPRT